MEKNDAEDLVIVYGLLCAVIGGRLGSVLFYDFHLQLQDPFYFLKIYQGGMSFHGGLIGVVIASIWFSKKNNHDTFKYFDIISLVAPIGIFFGRISNFINGELVGKVTNSNWGVLFPSYDDKLRHPSQLYEAFLEGILLFLILNYLYKTLSKQNGLISSIFLILYSLFRFLVEFTREPDPQLGFIIFNFTMGQVISIFTFLMGIYLYFLKYEKK